MDRAEWLPVERKTTHPTDVAVGRAASGCGPLLLGFFPAYFTYAFFGWASFGALIAVSVLPPFADWVLSRRARRREYARVLAELGPKDGDMVGVRAEFHRGAIFLGADQGYLWSEAGTTSFQGVRVAFRVGGPEWSDRWLGSGRAELLGPDGERVVLERWEKLPGGAGELPIVLAGTGPITPPPLVCDPALRPPSLAWRAPLAVAALAASLWAGAELLKGDSSAFSVLLVGGFAIWAVGRAVFSPVRRDREGRRG